MPVASFFSFAYLGKSYFSPKCAWINFNGNQLCSKPLPFSSNSRILAAWHGISGLVSLDYALRRVTPFALYLTGKGDSPPVVGYCLATGESAANHGARFNLRKSSSRAKVDVAVG
jgi:hypothetical protein